MLFTSKHEHGDRKRKHLEILREHTGSYHGFSHGAARSPALCCTVWFSTSLHSAAGHLTASAPCAACPEAGPSLAHSQLGPV